MCMSIQGHLLVAGLSNGNVHLINLQVKAVCGCVCVCVRVHLCVEFHTRSSVTCVTILFVVMAHFCLCLDQECTGQISSW